MKTELPHRIVYKGNWSFPVYKQFVLDPNYTIGEKILYIALRSYCAPDEETAFPSVKTLAAGLHVGPDSVRTYAAKLEKKGLINREQKREKTEAGSLRFSHTVWTVMEPKMVNEINDAVRSGVFPSREVPVTGEYGTNSLVQSRQEEKPVKNTVADAPVGPNQKFREWWIAEYPKHHSTPYMFIVADAVQAARLIKSGVSANDMIATAAQAWSHPEWFNCKQAVTIRAFVSRYNAIVEELKHPPTERATATKFHSRDPFGEEPEY